jgi:hypothetical protein
VRAAARKRLVELVRGGLDVAAAAAELDLDLDAVHADRELMAELNRAYHVATAKLRSRLLSRVLESDGDDKLLASLLEKREAAEAAMAAANAVGNAGGTLERMRKELLAEVERYRAAMSPQCVCCGAPCAVCGGAEATVLAPRPKDEPLVAAVAELPTLDVAQPLPRSRALVPEPPPPPEPCGRNVGRPRVLADPGSPWADGGDAAYPL